MIRANHRIRAREIRLIDENGAQVGVVPIAEGLRRAEAAGLDLVEISATSNPPVCRILDVGKYRYALDKRERQAKKKQHVVDVKELRISPKISEHDYQTKLRSAVNFLERGDKVKVTMFFRGREVTRVDRGIKLLVRVREDLSDVGELERQSGLEVNHIVAVFLPRRRAGAAKPRPDKPQAEPGPAAGGPPSAPQEGAQP